MRYRHKKKQYLQTWQEIINQSIVSAEDLFPFFNQDNIDFNKIKTVISKYPMRITPYYLSLIKSKDDPIWKQVIPDILELKDNLGTVDPLAEESQSPVPNLIHRYPDRVLFLVSDCCATYCRHCMRKRRIGQDKNFKSLPVTEETINLGIEYINKNKSIKDVILSGGDPLLLEDNLIEKILKQINKISHVDIIRIHTRTLCTLPERITPKLIEILKQFKPIFINTHFNHVNEITTASVNASTLLIDAGIPVGCQSVLLKGVNDTFEDIKNLMRSLIKIRIKPYYIHHPDLVKGTKHFRVSINKGLNIMKKLRGNVSGMCIPQYMIDLPGGGGKIPLLPEYIKGVQNGNLIVKNYNGDTFLYPIE